ncbi:MAG: acetolactate synthase 2 small subunit [Rheinheimera sp.]|jgi:acetolactate synthase II small subunit|nr:acetolactate synthase 2 small subunit [Rheinheimera sp.]
MMAQHCLTIRTRNEPVVLERLLQVTRYRGFELTAMDMRPLAEFGSMLITLNISSDKPISLLTNQLNKLYDIQTLELHSAQPQSLSA